MTPSSLTPGLILVHGNHPETLRDLLVEWMKRHPLGPLEKEIILAQSNGIAQWLKLALAADADPAPGGRGIAGSGLGIAAALEISLPSRFLWRVYRSVLGADAVPETSPFDKARLLWRLMRLLPEVSERLEYAPLRRFLTRDADLRKRFQLADRLADLFDQYQVYRADWLARWARGEDVLIDARGARRPLPHEQRWQAALWRALLEDVPRTAPRHPGGGSNAGRAAIHEAFLRRAGDWPRAEPPRGLPRRLVVFGISSLPRQSLEVLAALARWTQILVCVHNPCEHYWAEIVSDKDVLRAGRAGQRRPDGMPADLSEESLHLHAHPLLAAWGKQGRDFIGLLDALRQDAEEAGEEGTVAAIGQRIELFGSNGGDTLLQQLQDDIRDLRPLAETRALWPPVEPADASIRFHIAHSPLREVEILHDRLLAAFNTDASLTPRDVIVMVPDIDIYAPHIRAVFGLLDQADPRWIPFSIADQAQRSTDPLLRAVERLLDLPHSRLAVSDLLDLLEVPALRRRFGIAEEALPQLHRWIRGANIRWGLHAEQRAGLELPAHGEEASQHTWSFGLRRMLLGYAVGPGGGAWRGIEPYDEIGGLDAALLGPLVQLIERLDRAWRALREPATVADWVTRLRNLLADVFCADRGEEAYTLLQLDHALQEWQEVCQEAALAERLPLSVVGDHWLSRLDAGGLSQRFLGGAVTFATLMPMRAIPFRRVCLLGMNDGDYPRARIPMDFDLMRQDSRPGDRSRREDDHYLFLEAVLSARDHLHLSWVGRSIVDNSARPPSVLVAQLRDHLAAGWRLAGVPETAEGHPADRGQALLQALTLEHRLQPFSPQYFPPDPDASDWFTYASEWRPARTDQSQARGLDQAKRHRGAATPGSRLSADAAQARSGPDTGLKEAPGGAAGSRPHWAMTHPGAPALPPLRRDEPVSLRELAELLKAPVKTFFRQRLGIAFELDDPSGEDQEPFGLDPLGRWHLRDELIRAQSEALGQGGAIDRARAERLARIRRRGDLAPGAFGEAMAEELLAPMDHLFERYLKALERWPNPVEDEAVLFAVTIDGETRELVDWLTDIRADALGRRGRVVLETSDLVQNNRYRGDRLIRHWVTHLAAHLTGESLRTLAVSPAGEVELRPLAVGDARAHVARLLTAWHEGTRRPLPLAAKTAFAWLKDADPAGARKVYDGGYRQLGEVQADPCLARAFPDFDTLFASGEFAELAEDLLRPLLDTIDSGAREPSAPGGRRAEGTLS